MANRPAVQVDGLRRLGKALKDAGDDDLLAELKGANLDAAKLVENTARPDVPTRTGRLAASLRSSATARAGVVRIGKASLPYAPVVHFGWARRPDRSRRIRGGPIAPNTYLYDALDRRAGEVERLYLERLERLSEQIAG